MWGTEPEFLSDADLLAAYFATKDDETARAIAVNAEIERRGLDVRRRASPPQKGLLWG